MNDLPLRTRLACHAFYLVIRFLAVTEQVKETVIKFKLHDADSSNYKIGSFRDFPE